MKSLNENIKRILNLMEVQHGVVYPLIKEQNSEYWDKIQGVGNNPKGKKVVGKEFSSNNPLTYPGKGVLTFNEVNNKLGVYVGAYLQAQYQPLVKPVDSAGNNISAPFGFDIQFYLADEKGSSGYPNNSQHQANYFRIKGAKLKSGKFQIITLINYTPEFAKSGFIAADGTRVSMEVSSAINMLLGNLDGWMGSLRKDISDELVKMGYPELPNSLKYNGAQEIS